jgi:hypothetical protein
VCVSTTPLSQPNSAVSSRGLHSCQTAEITRSSILSAVQPTRILKLDVGALLLCGHRPCRVNRAGCEYTHHFSQHPIRPIPSQLVQQSNPEIHTELRVEGGVQGGSVRNLRRISGLHLVQEVRLLQLPPSTCGVRIASPTTRTCGVRIASELRENCASLPTCRVLLSNIYGCTVVRKLAGHPRCLARIRMALTPAAGMVGRSSTRTETFLGTSLAV